MGVYRNAEATDSTHLRAFQTLIIILVTFLFGSSFAHLIIAGSPNEEIASAIATLLSIFLYEFCGVLAGPKALPRFWIFMYRVNPFTYIVSSIMNATLGMAPAHCAENEFITFDAPSGMNCGEYMSEYISRTGGHLRDAMASGQCQFCQLDNTEQYLKTLSVNWDTRWRDFGLLWVYVAFNVAGAIFLYWLFRVPKGKKTKGG